MGEYWTVGCEAHRESLSIGKARHLDEVRRMFPRDQVKALRMLRKHYTVERGLWRPKWFPEGIPRDLETQWTERFLGLLEAFVSRHARCGLRLLSNSQDSETDYVWDTDERWSHFYVL